MSLAADPTFIVPGLPTTLTVTFTSCIPDGTPVIFSSIDTAITPSISSTVQGKASASLSSDFNAIHACATTDSQSICMTLNTGYARFNFGCMCTDKGSQHILIGSYNDPAGIDNKLMGCVFDADTSTTISITPADLGTQVLNSVAVYNTDNSTYIALLTKQNDNYLLRLATCADNGSGFAFTLSDTAVTLSNPTAKVQWILGSDGTPYIITDMQETLNIFKADLSTLTLTLHDTTTNMAGSTNSNFLYWTIQDTQLYAVQGYGTTHVITYKVDTDTVTFLNSGIDTDISETFSTVPACSTCFNYLVLGGTDNTNQGIVARYSINSDGTLSLINSAYMPTAAVYYCERCCCNTNQLLVGTDTGLYSLDPASLIILAANTSMPNNDWVNTCWCCDSSVVYCSAIDGNHHSYIFQEQGSNLVKVCDL